MREQGHSGLPPAERQKSTSNLGKREGSRGPILHISRASKKWMAFEAETPGGAPAGSRIDKKLNGFHTKENLKQAEIVAEISLAKEARQEINGLKGDLCIISGAPPSSNGIALLQWGHRKRARCSRVDNHHLKHSSEESPVLSRKTVRVKSEKIFVAGGGSGALVSVKGNGVRKRPRLPSVSADMHTRGLEDGRKRAKTLRVVPELVKGHSRAPTEAGTHTEKRTPYISQTNKTHTSPDHRIAMVCVENIEISTAKFEFDWPKILFSLSRKEKEDDFLIIKGSKLPQRPKRRPKAVEKALHFCTPGGWLTDLSRGRYEVRDKKCAKKKLRGLKVMDSMESDSD